jgi:hypothetical protein
MRMESYAFPKDNEYNSKEEYVFLAKMVFFN